MKWIQSRREVTKDSLAILVVLIVSVLGVKILMASYAATGAVLSLSSTSASVTPGSTFLVTIHEDSGTDPINSVQASLGYDATQLQYVSMSEGTAFPTVAADSTGTPGIVRIGRATTTPVTGSNPVVTITFKVLASSGPISLSYDKNYSFAVRSTDNIDVLSMTTGLSVPVSGTTSATASMSLSPASSSVESGLTFTVTIRENSDTSVVNAVQSSVTYDAAKLQYVSMTEGGIFTNIAATDTVTAGRVRVARSVQAGAAGVTGDNPVVTLTFKTLGTSGTTAVNFDKTQSFVTLASSGEDVLGTIAGSTFTMTSTPAPTATLSLSPTNGSFTKDSIISVAVKETSSATPATTVQSTINYPAAQLQYVGVTEGTVFTTVQRTDTTSSGVIDIIRGIPGGSTGVGGTNTVVTLSFKVLGSTGTAPLTFGTTSAIFDGSGTGVSILDLANSTTANYTISEPTPTCTDNPTQPSAPAQTVTGYTTLSLSWPQSTASNGCVLAGYHIMRDGIKVGDVTAGTTFADSGLVSGTNYVYTIQAFDAAGHVSTISNAVTMTTKTDDQSPSTPAGVMAAAPGAASVNLSWNPSSDFPVPGGVGLAGYRIYRNNATVPTYTVANITTYTDTNVTASTTYSYSVTAYDLLGNESAPSNIVSAKTAAGVPVCTSNPSTPIGLKSAAITVTTVKLSWTASAPATGCTLAGYHLYRDSTFIGNAAGIDYTDGGLTPSTSYSYTVQSYDTGGHVSAMSAAVAVVTASDTSAPTVPTNAAGTAVSPGQISLSWSASTDNVAVTGYRIYRSNTYLTTTSAAARGFNDTLVVANSSYTYDISAVDAAGNESARSRVQPSPVHTPKKTDTTSPTTPTQLRAVAITTTSIAFAWNPSSDNRAVAGYHVYRDRAYVGDATQLSYVSTGLKPNTSYRFTLKAYDASGNTSSASRAIYISTLPATASKTAPYTTTLRPVVAITLAAFNTSLSSNDDDVIELQAPADVSPLPLQPDGVNKIEYRFDGRLAATVKSLPYTYRLDTTNVLNGTHRLTTKTYYMNGQFKTVSQTVVVKNKFGLTQIVLLAKKYAWLIVIVVLIIVATIATRTIHKNNEWSGHKDMDDPHYDKVSVMNMTRDDGVIPPPTADPTAGKAIVAEDGAKIVRPTTQQ